MCQIAFRLCLFDDLQNPIKNLSSKTICNERQDYTIIIYYMPSWWHILCRRNVSLQSYCLLYFTGPEFLNRCEDEWPKISCIQGYFSSTKLNPSFRLSPVKFNLTLIAFFSGSFRPATLISKNCKMFYNNLLLYSTKTAECD